MEMLVIRDVSFSYSQESKVFDQFSADFDGQFFGLIGPNGAGKSTLLKLALGLLQPDKGEILVNGVSIRKYRKQVLQQVGVLHENSQFPSWTQVFSYLRWVGVLRGLTRQDATEQAMYFLDVLGLRNKHNAMVKHLSAGQRQRFGIAQALIGLPRLVFLDEPTANLDVHYRNVVFELLKEISTEHDTKVIVMSHILSDLERFCDNYAILYRGEVCFQGTMSELLQNSYHHEYVLRGSLPELLHAVQQSSSKHENEQIRILKQGINELVVWVSNPQVLERIREKLPKGSSLTPYRSLLEEKFLQVTEMQENTGEARTHSERNDLEPTDKTRQP